MKTIIGQPVYSKNFWGRETIIKMINETLANSSILLCAPRRYGKTSLLYKLKEISSEQIVYVNGEDSYEINELISHFIFELKQKSKFKFFDNILKSFDHRRLDMAELKFELKQTAEDDIVNMWLEQLSKIKNNIYYFVDELSFLLNNLIQYDKTGGKAVRFLKILRNIRMSNSKVRFLISTEMDIFQLATNYSLNAYLNDFTIITLPEWTDEEALEFIKIILDSYSLKYEKNVPKLIIERIKPHIPFLIQVFLWRLIQLIKIENRIQIEEKDIDFAYNELLKEPESAIYLEDLFSRLKEYFNDKEHILVLQILNQIALSTKEFIPLDELSMQFGGDNSPNNGIKHNLLYSLKILEDNGYITINNNNTLSMKSKMLKDWWKNNKIIA